MNVIVTQKNGVSYQNRWLPKKNCNTNQNVIKMGVIIDVVYCNIYQCFLVAQGDPKKKGAATPSPTYGEIQNKFYFTPWHAWPVAKFG